MEKFAIAKSKLFLDQGNCLILPSLELIYMWNGFRILGSRYKTVEPLYILVEKAIRVHEKNTGKRLMSIRSQATFYLLSLSDAANIRFNNFISHQIRPTKMKTGVCYFYFGECVSNT